MCVCCSPADRHRVRQLGDVLQALQDAGLQGVRSHGPALGAAHRGLPHTREKVGRKHSQICENTQICEDFLRTSSSRPQHS